MHLVFLGAPKLVLVYLIYYHELLCHVISGCVMHFRVEYIYVGVVGSVSMVFRDADGVSV